MKRDQVPGKVYSFAVVVSTYHRLYTFGMLTAVQRELKGHRLEVVQVPGAFEIPLQVQRLARRKKYDAILALGVIWQGKTRHAEEILRACTDSIMRISLENNVPVLHEILSVNSEKEVEARTLGTRLNRGTEAAVAALAVAGLSRK